MYKYMNLLESKRFITTGEFLTKLEISNATFKRDLAVLRERFDVPIVYDRFIGAYELDHGNVRMRLPGVWFSKDEIQAIQTISHQCLSTTDPIVKNSLIFLASKFERINKNKS
jgi:predicted DNA-binding transcriptional regulator YafY